MTNEMLEEPKLLSPLEIEQRSTREDIRAATARLHDLENRFENPGLSEGQHRKARTAIQKLLSELDSLQKE